VIPIAFYLVIFGIDAGAGLYLALHWHLVSTLTPLGLSLGVLTAVLAGLTTVSIWVFLLVRRSSARFWTVVIDAGAFAWLAFGNPVSNGAQGNFLSAAIVVALITNFWGGATAMFWLPLPERADAGAGAGGGR
jgi:hypothetical protein